MKILSIEFEKHPILGNLKLDFTDKKGNPVDTVILAGENGCGKTTILEELYRFLYNKDHNANCEGQRIISKIFFDNAEMDKIIKILPQRILLENPTGVFEITDNLTLSRWGCFNVKYENKNKQYTEIACDFISYVQKFINAIFSTIGINYQGGNVSYVTSKNLDLVQNTNQRSDAELAHNINQMLVDIDTLDSSDLKAWILEHPEQYPPKSIHSPRIQRFINAFSFMFNDLNFYKVDNSQDSKVILFKRKDKEIPISQLSSGEKQIVYRGSFLLQNIKTNLGKLVLIDEPEISMHPEWQRKILGYYQKLFTDETGKQLSQIFIATHSPFIIHNPDRHNDKVIVLKKDDGGNIIQSDKPEYYDCNSCKAVEDSFSVYEFNDDKQKTIFVEDSAHENIVKKLLAEYHSDIAVSKLGSCDKVLSTSKGVKESFDNFYFLIDGDCKTYNDADLWHNNTLQLKKYCIENYLLTKEAITHLLTLKREKISAEEFIKDVIDECKSGYSGFTVLKDSIDKYGLDWSAIDNVDASKIFEKIKNKLGYKSAIDVENVCFDALNNPNKLGTVFQEIIDFLGLQDAEE